MHEREFAMAKSLLAVLSGRSRSGPTTNTNSAANATTAVAPRSGRRYRFDDKSGPPPPRGSLTVEKLSYLDWRLKRINQVRHKSERTPDCWIDGRDTIGRTSFAMERTAVPQDPEEIIVPVEALKAVPVMPRGGLPAIYAQEKAAGLDALKHAYANDSVLADLPRLAKRDSSSGSEISAPSEPHSSDLPLPAVLDASDDNVGVYFSKPRKSFLSRASSRLSKHKTSAKVESTLKDGAEARPAARTTRSLRWRR